MTNLFGIAVLSGFLVIAVVWAGSVILFKLLFWILRKTEK
jgi:hypothetical protein